MKKHSMRQYITFLKTADNVGWQEYFSCHAYINGLSGTEFFLANAADAGYDSSLTVEIECRYCPELMKVIPSTYKIIDEHGTEYDIISPADDIQLMHKTIKFRGKRITNDNL